ncbi:aldo/keto reductase [Alkalihalobacillus sp. TS-13]|uniref:aldo/keto reductase n=1 Tax=Alkalihalobacillus sp. TS-13 TaxID=2842455 RepID=UPI0028929B40|nr:aldo/keto reductase [Alkalihalobacillus sp. TS-13]
MEFQALKGVIDKKYTEKICSKLIFGTAHFHEYERKDQAFNLMDDFVELSGNMFDTAHQYLNSEVILGEWIENRGIRDSIYILTKGAHPDDGEPGPRLNPAAITNDLMESLERLRTNYIDFYALHRDDKTVDVGLIMEVLNEHIAKGRIHAIGASNWTHPRIQEANAYASKHGLIGFTFNSPNLSLAKCNEPRWSGCVSADEELLDWHTGSQMPLLSWSSQAGGFFSGRFSPDVKSDEEMVRVYYSPENWERYERARTLAETKGVSPIQIALAYVLNQPFSTWAVIGPFNKTELLSSVEGAKVKLSSKEMDWLNLKGEMGAQAYEK